LFVIRQHRNGSGIDIVFVEVYYKPLFLSDDTMWCLCTPTSVLGLLTTLAVGLTAWRHWSY